MLRNLFLASAALGSALAVVAPAYSAPAPVSSAGAKPSIGSWGFDTAGMDRSVKPGDSFPRFASGNWEKTTEIPADKPAWGAFSALQELSNERTRAVVEEAAKANAPKGSIQQKVGDFYASFMNEAAIEAKGIAPLKPLLAGVEAIRTKSDLARALGEANRDGINVPFEAGVQPDIRDNQHHAVYLGQGGLGLPDRDYYLDEKNPKFAEARARYQQHIARMLELAGIPDSAAKAQRIYELERQIAEAQWSRVEQRQMEKLYNPVATADLDASMPGLDWNAYLTAAGVRSQPRIIVAHPSALKGAAALVASQQLETWKDYLTFRTISAAAPLLPKAFVDENFALYGKLLAGTPQLSDRWKRGLAWTNNALGEGVGQLYVARYFPPESKAKAERLVQNLIAAMDQHLAALQWMAPETKVKARAKLAAFKPMLGYPDKWRDYSKLDIVRGDALGNARRAQRFEYQRGLDKLGQPVDRSEWGMTPQTVNAYADPTLNQIVFPAAVLQPPFFDPNADEAVNYGGIGTGIGHEISHHFDDQGRKFDARGNLADWWTPEDVTRFKALTEQVVKQYGTYEPLPGKKINGELTLGENIADLAGLAIAYDAYKMSLGGKETPVIDGYTGDQRFFLGFAQVWRGKYRDAFLQQYLTTNEHSPNYLRPNVVRNFDPWYAAFDVKDGALFLPPEQRIKIW